MKACFAANAKIPITCSWDIDEVHNCLIASEGTPRDKCRYWRPDMTLDLCKKLLEGSGYVVSDGKDAARLDWLADPANGIGNVQLPSQCVLDNLTCMRGAIDQAMAMKC